MEPISLLNKVVRVSNVNDLSFYFPDFEVKQSLSMLDYGDKIIYTGPLNKRASTILESCTYIATQGLYQYDLTDRKEKIKFVYSKWGREVPKNILDSVDLYDDDEFDHCCKTYWIVGRWPYKLEHEASIYDFYQSAVQPINTFIKAFFEVSKSYPIGVIEQSFFTFMQRAKTVDEQNVSPTYKRLLKSFANTSEPKFKSCMLSFIDSPISNRELRFIEFIMNLRS